MEKDIYKSELSAKPASLRQDAVKRLKKSRIAVISFIVIVIYSFLAIATWQNWIFENYDTPNPAESYQTPSFKHPFGTDIQGRDILARTIHGTKISMSVGLITAAIYIPIAIILGALAGYFGGLIDDVIQWLYQTLASIPDLLLLIALTFVLGKGLINVYIAIGITGWVGLCRLMRAEFMKHKERDYVTAAKALGAGHFRIMFRHILPNTLHIVIINFSLRFVSAIASEVVLSYVGVGVEPGKPSWGLIISGARAELARQPAVWWPLVSATIAMFIICLAFNLFSDSLRDALDPKLRST
ncbi:MAG: ABC transporter permease [Planctomycetota bacterium]